MAESKTEPLHITQVCDKDKMFEPVKFESWQMFRITKPIPSDKWVWSEWMI